jgi:hypothetical protein
MNTKFQKKKGYHYRREDLLTAIIIMPDPLRPGYPKGVKYRNIEQGIVTRSRFENKAKQLFPAATHINYYGGITGDFHFRTTYPR